MVLVTKWVGPLLWWKAGMELKALYLDPQAAGKEKLKACPGLLEPQGPPP